MNSGENKMKEYYDVYNLSEDFIENINYFHMEDNDEINAYYDENYEHAFSGSYAEYNKLSCEDFMSDNNLYSDNWLDDIDYSQIDMNCNRREDVVLTLRIDINKVIKTFRYFNWREPYNEDEILNYVETGQFDEEYIQYTDAMKLRELGISDDSENIKPQVMLRSVFDEKVFDTWGDKISRVGEYKSSTEYMVFKCNECGNMFPEVGRYIYNGKGCPSCDKKFRKGENVVEEILKNLNIDFEKQCHDGCFNPKTNRPLPFDFVINNYGTTIYVEVQGFQHYKPVEYFGGNESFESRKYRDDIKKNYAKNNGIFVELDYKEHDLKLLRDRVNSILLPLLKEVI